MKINNESYSIWLDLMCKRIFISSDGGGCGCGFGCGDGDGNDRNNSHIKLVR